MTTGTRVYGRTTTTAQAGKDMWDMKTSVTQGQDRLVSIGQVRQVRLHTKERTARPKTLDRRLCTDRSGEAVVIFLFGLEALLTRDSRVHYCVVSSSPKL